MVIKAKVSFSGPLLSMAAGEKREVENKELLSDLLDANYVEEDKPKKAVTKRESK